MVITNTLWLSRTDLLAVQPSQLSADVKWPRATLWRRAEVWIQSTAFLVTAVLIARMARKLPVEPLTTGDSYAYQYMLGYRPPFYGWFIIDPAWVILSYAA